MKPSLKSCNASLRLQMRTSDDWISSTAAAAKDRVERCWAREWGRRDCFSLVLQLQRQGCAVAIYALKPQYLQSQWELRGIGCEKIVGYMEVICKFVATNLWYIFARRLGYPPS